MLKITFILANLHLFFRYDNRYVKLHSKQRATAKSGKTDKQDKIPPANKKGKAQKAAPQANPEKFHLYLDFEQSIKFIKPHQVWMTYQHIQI